MKPFGKRVVGAFTGALVLACAAACGSGAGTQGSSSSDTSKLVLGTFFGAQTNFDPWASPDGDNPELQVEQLVYDSLTHVGPDGQVTPALANSWTFTDPTTLVIKLRTGIKFSDGSPLDAAAVKANFDYAAKAQPAGSFQLYMAQLTTTVVDATTVKVVSKTPQPDLPTDFAIGGGFIVNPKALANPASLKSKPDGTGPYTLTSSVQGQQYTFSRRGDYWGLPDYPYSTIQLKNFSSAQAADNAMAAGQIQGEQAAQESSIKSASAAGLGVHQSTPVTTDGIWLSDRAGKIVPALGNVKVRQALNYAVDRAAIIKALDPDVETPGSLIVPSEMLQPGAGGASSYTYDPGKAKQLLTEAGYPNGFTLPVLTDQVDPATEAVAGYLSKIGVKLQIENHGADYLNQLFSGKWAASAFAQAAVPTIQALSTLLSPVGLANFNHSTDPAIDALLNTVETASSSAQQAAATQLVDKVNDEAWFLIIGYSRSTYITSKSVTCDIGQRSVCPIYTFRPANTK